MDKVGLGRTNLRASVMGLGGGGFSQLGKRTGRTEAESVAVVREALALGVNYFDTAENYGTEEIVGKGIAGRDRSQVIVSTKKSTRRGITPQTVVESCEGSLTRLGTDYIDVYSLHGVYPQDYDDLYAEIVPALIRLKEQGKIRFIGITEMFNADTGHDMLRRALQDDVWDVFMVGFNLINQSAREAVFPGTLKHGIGTQVMFAIRNALSRPERLREVLDELLDSGQVNRSDIDLDDPLGFLMREGGAESVVDGAYRFCRYEPGTDVILSGTGNLDHLRANVASFARPPLAPEAVARLRRIFGRVDSVTGQ